MTDDPKLPSLVPPGINPEAAAEMREALGDYATALADLVESGSRVLETMTSAVSNLQAWPDLQAAAAAHMANGLAETAKLIGLIARDFSPSNRMN